MEFEIGKLTELLIFKICIDEQNSMCFKAKIEKRKG